MRHTPLPRWRDRAPCQSARTRSKGKEEAGAATPFPVEKVCAGRLPPLGRIPHAAASGGRSRGVAGEVADRLESGSCPVQTWHHLIHAQRALGCVAGIHAADVDMCGADMRGARARWSRRASRGGPCTCWQHHRVPPAHGGSSAGPLVHSDAPGPFQVSIRGKGLARDLRLEPSGDLLLRRRESWTPWDCTRPAAGSTFGRTHRPRFPWTSL